MFRQRLFSKLLKKFTRFYSKRGCDSAPSIKTYCTKVSKLSNGMRVATEESFSPIACVALFVEAGPIYEKPENFGISHFIEHMVYRGFKCMSRQQLESCLYNMGAKLSVTTTREFQIFYGQCCVENVPNIISILSRITELELSYEEIEMAKYMIDLESHEVDRNPKAVVTDYLHETAFQGVPLGRRIIGNSWNIKKFDKNVVESYMKENYFPTRFLLVTSGAVSHENIVSTANENFGQLTQTCSVDYSPPQRFTGSHIVYRDDSMHFVHAALAVEAPGMGHPDYLAMWCASNIIGSWSKSQGGSDRHGPPLVRAAATDSMCNTFESFYYAYRNVGLWGIYVVAEKMDIDDMIITLQNRWMHLCTTTLKTDVERGINASKLELAKKIDGSLKSCYDIATQIMYKSERTSLPELYDKLEKLTPKTIKNAASNYLYDKCPALAAMGPTEALPDYTRLRAGMYWLRL